MEGKEMLCEACGKPMKSPYSHMDENGNWRYHHKHCYFSSGVKEEKKEYLTLIDILKNGNGKEYRIVEPACKELAPAYNMWLGFSVANHNGAVVCTDSADVENVAIGTTVPLCGMVTKSKWKEVRKWPEV